MNAVRKSTFGIGLAFILAACAVETTPESPEATGGSGNPGTGGSTGGSVGGTPSAGTTASGGTGTGGVGGTGGSGGVGVGGAGPAGAGGSGGVGVGGAGPAGAGGSGGADPGTGGSGGVDPGTGGSTGGGAGDTGAGGLPAGGTGNAGGSPAGGAAGSAGGAPPVIVKPEVITSAQNAYWQMATATHMAAGNADVTVNDGSPAQTWTGFGGTVNEKGWDALGALSQADRDRALRLLFDAADGAKFTSVRIPIGASDYATNRYTLNDSAGDTAMANFSIARDKMKLIPYIKAAIAVNANLHFWGSPWTPPPWMKDNNAYDRGNMKDDATNLAAYAVYLAKFVELYGAEGVKIEAIHPQNEPGFAQDYPSCLWSGALMAKFIGQHLGPTFASRNVTAQIFIGTMSNSNTDGTVLTTTMANATAKSFIKGYGLQWGMYDTYNNLGLDRNLAIWQTEHKCGNYPWVGGTNQSRAPNDHAYGVESWGLIRDWIKRGVNQYSAWNMVLDTVGRSLDTVRPWAQNALLAVDTGSKQLILTPTYYVFRHFSQYVDPGAKVVGTSGGDAIAFKNPDGSITTVMFNSGGAKSMIVAVGGDKIQFQMPGNGWATVNFKP